MNFQTQYGASCVTDDADDVYIFSMWRHILLHIDVWTVISYDDCRLYADVNNYY